MHSKTNTDKIYKSILFFSYTHFSTIMYLILIWKIYNLHLHFVILAEIIHLALRNKLE